MGGRFVTLGPDTNHAVVAERYLAFHGMAGEALQFVDTPEEALARLRAGSADWFLLCAVHPDAPATVAQFHHGVFVADTFIAPSKPLAILTHADVPEPRRIGLFTPVEGYADVSGWPERVSVAEGSLATIGARLLAREFDSALVYEELAARYPGRFRIDARIESPDDAWLVFGRQRVAGPDGLVACRGSAPARLVFDRGEQAGVVRDGSNGAPACAG